MPALRYVTNVSWSDVPHLTDQEKDDLLSAIPEYQRKARAQGIPILGSGVIYPFDETSIKVDPFDPPRHWPRCFGGDTDAGAGWTAFAWLAWDRESGTVYLTHDYKNNNRSIAVHVEALHAKGQRLAPHKPLWIPGVADASGLLVTDKDSAQVIELYRERGVDIDLPDKAVEAGIQDVYDLMNTGKFKAFSSCSAFFAEFRMYHRNDGKIVKSNDHVMDAVRYAVRSGLQRAKVAPLPETDTISSYQYDRGMQGTGWLGT